MPFNLKIGTVPSHFIWNKAQRVQVVSEQMLIFLFSWFSKFLAIIHLCILYSQKTVFYSLKRRCKKMRILLQHAFNSKVKFQLGVDLPSLPEDYPLSYTGKPSIIDHIFWLLKVFEKVRSRINHTANIFYELLIGLLKTVS